MDDTPLHSSDFDVLMTYLTRQGCEKQDFHVTSPHRFDAIPDPRTELERLWKGVSGCALLLLPEPSSLLSPPLPPLSTLLSSDVNDEILVVVVVVARSERG
jgi:hypothetical protein